MEKRNRIIVLVDFSKYSENLINFAFNIQSVINAKIIFVHKIDAIVPALADEASRNEILRVEVEEAHLNLRDLVQERVRDKDAFQVSSKPILSILQGLSSKQYFDWVLTGLLGKGTIKRLLIGSTALSIIDESHLLTIAVPVRTQITLPKKLLVGVTSKYAINQLQLKNILIALKEHIRELEFFTILKDHEDEIKARAYLLELQAQYEAHTPQIKLYKGNNAFNLLKERVKTTEDSFLILQQGSRSLKDKIFRTFMINELVYHAQTPLIVLSK